MSKHKEKKSKKQTKISKLPGSSAKLPRSSELLAVLGIKPKRQPRGKGFAKGNKHGYRFKKGDDPNRNMDGRPKCKLFSEAARDILETDVEDMHRKPRTVAELFAAVLMVKGSIGDRGSIQEIVDRAEGKPRQSVDVNDNRKDPFIELIAAMKTRSRKIGPAPEDEQE